MAKLSSSVATRLETQLIIDSGSLKSIGLKLVNFTSAELSVDVSVPLRIRNPDIAPGRPAAWLW